MTSLPSGSLTTGFTYALKYLHRGGRVSKTAAIAGSILGIKPLLHVDNEGHLIPVGKIRGRKQSIEKLVDMMCERMGNWDNSTVAVCHGDCLSDAEYAADLMRRKLGKKTTVHICYTGAVIGSHSGPGTLAIKIQYKSGRSPKTSSAIFICDIKGPLPFSKLYHYLQAA